QSAVLHLSLDLHLPVIATRVGGLSESIIEGVNGLLVEPKDADLLSHALLRYFDEGLESSMRSHIRQEHSQGWGRIVKYIESLASDFVME
ncbi:MAG: glycosyltransferase, partial [Chloroflexota bacterium]|nr:glycosyltransferase [Chloroflexota bacterium]